MKVTKDNLFEYLRSVIEGAIPDSKYVRVLLPEGEYKDIRFALDAIPPMGDSLYDDGRMMVVYRGVRIEFVCDYLTDDEELTYVLLENEMLRGELDYSGKELVELRGILDRRKKMLEREVSLWRDRFYINNDSLCDKLEKIPTFVRKIFGAL